MRHTDNTALKRYLDEIGGESSLTDKEEFTLAEQIQNNDIVALDKLTKANLKFVVYIAKQYQYQGVDIEDLVSEGNIGLLHAATKYSKASNKRFSAFAAPYIRKQIEQFLAKIERNIPVPQKESASLKSPKILSVDSPIPIGSHNGYNLLNVLKNTNVTMVDELVNNNSAKEEIIRIMDNVLDERQQQVIRMFFGIDCEKQTFGEIATIMNLKRERVRQIRNIAIKKISKIAKNIGIDK